MKRLAAIVLLLASTACTREVAAPLVPAGDAAAVQIPTQVLGLTVAPEKVTKEADKVNKPYVDSVAVFSLREDELLRATLQVARFNRSARPRDPGFLRSVVGVLGSIRPVALRVGGRTVYSTASNRQTVFVWFEGDGMFILSVSEEYEFPRTLLRRVLSARLSA